MTQPNAGDRDQNRTATSLGDIPASDLQILISMRQGLDQWVMPELSTKMARWTCDSSIQMLDQIIAKHTDWIAILRGRIEKKLGILRDVGSRLAEEGVLDQPSLREVGLLADRIDDSLRVEAPVDRLEGLDRDIEEALEPLVRRMVEVDAAQSSTSPDILRELAAAMGESERALRASIDRRNTYFAAQVGAHTQLTAEGLTAYLLDSRAGTDAHCEVVSFNELAGGSSKSTILVDVRGFEPGHEISPLVVRADRRAGSTDTKVLDEAPTLKAVFQLGLPVPEVVLEEPDAEHIGVPFIMVRGVQGKVGGSVGQVDLTECDAGTALDLARVLAALHGVEPAEPGLRGALRTDPLVHPMESLLRRARLLWYEKRLQPDATVEACLRWLENNIPAAPARLSLIHGDLKFNNFIVKDKRIAGLLDWELSHVGDPTEDLSYLRREVEQLLPWSSFMDEYQRHGGRPYREEHERYYQVWRGVRNAIYGLTSLHSFRTGANLDVRWALYGAYYRPMLAQALDRILDPVNAPANARS